VKDDVNVKLDNVGEDVSVGRYMWLTKRVN